jgi:hypothetical protein
MRQEGLEYSDGPRQMGTTLKAIKQVFALKPPCWRRKSHGTAMAIVTIDGEWHAVCRACAAEVRLDRRIARLKEERSRMAARGR